MKPKFLIIGAGSRGIAYARGITSSTNGTIHAVAEPDPYKRTQFGTKYIWGEDRPGPQEGQEFRDWQEWIEWECQRRHQLQSQSQQHDDKRGVDGLFICTLDETHVEILLAISEKHLTDLHIFCEKPLALSLRDCLDIYSAFHTTSITGNQNRDADGGLSTTGTKSIFSIGHVLRYNPHNILLRRLLHTDKVIGRIISIEHTEPVGYWHFAHSYVRGNWRRATPAGDGSLLTKSCHDIDFLLWLVDSSQTSSLSFSSSSSKSIINTPSAERQNETQEDQDFKVQIRSITSTGHITQFRPSRKPPAAGKATTNCLSCPIERQCLYSAPRIYRDLNLRQGIKGWPVKIVVPDIEAIGTGKDASITTTQNMQEEHLLARLREDYDPTTMTDAEIASRPWYGRCVYEADNTVCDDQTVTITFDPVSPTSSLTDKKGREGGITALFHMIAHTEPKTDRRGKIYGTHGELTYNSHEITVFSYQTGQRTTVEVPKLPPEEAKGHGGGDFGLARAFVTAVENVMFHGWEVERAQSEFVGCSFEDVIRSHAVVFAAEEARREEKVVKWLDWWAEKLASLA